MFEIKNGIIEGNLDIHRFNLDEFISNLPNIKQINGYLCLDNLNLYKLPDLSNITINGGFDCSNNQLTSLKGCPKQINGSFDCYGNSLKSFEGCTKIIKGKAWFDKEAPIDINILNIINNLPLDELYLNKKDCLPLLREIQLKMILDETI